MLRSRNRIMNSDIPEVHLGQRGKLGRGRVARVRAASYAFALSAVGPTNRRTIRLLNASVYCFTSKPTFAPSC